MLFHEALCRKGYLGIGSKESLRFSAYAESFDETVPAMRIFQKKGAA
jgi:chemotaxis protein methyltransferase CheR